jgi:Ca-activated chloride channel family protein
VAIAVAKQLGIKIYTVGIGEDTKDQLGHFFLYAPMSVNKPLLQEIAKETGGLFFEATNAQDMRQIYDTIDTLEKNKLEHPLYDQRHDWFLPLLWISLVLILSEVVVATFIWFGL